MGFGLDMGAFGQGMLNGYLLQKRLKAANTGQQAGAAANPGATGEQATGQPQWQEWLRNLLGGARSPFQQAVDNWQGGPSGTYGQSTYGGGYPEWMAPMMPQQNVAPGGVVAGNAAAGGQDALYQRLQLGAQDRSPNSYNPYSSTYQPGGGYGLYGAPGLSNQFYNGPAPDFNAAVQQSLSWPTRYPAATTAAWYNQPFDRYFTPPAKPAPSGQNGGGQTGAPTQNAYNYNQGPYDENGNFIGFNMPGGG